VWVRPDLRGRGIATAALATVFAHALALAPSVSLCVNDFNVAARRLYARLGMRQHATLSTVLLS
jgi:predicted GNAT family acetyltransferase